MVEQQRVLKQNADAPPLGGAFIAAFVVEPQLAAGAKRASSAPIIQANSVDLPLPDGPISVSTSPGETENAISRSRGR
jgi:hypothetical protein